MKKTILLIFAFIATLSGMAQVQLPYQELGYNVHYHWGLINVMIGHGKVTLSSNGNQFFGTLDGNSIPWDGRVFCVSDTLQATMSPGTPVSQETVTYENGWYMKPKASVYQSGGYNPQNPANYKNIKGQGSLNADGETMEAVTVTADMLGMFYYYHEIDFENMTPGQQITIPITVEGGENQEVVVTYRGKSSYNASGIAYPTYSTTFEYSYNGSMSGYPVRAEVSMGERIPVLLSASLPIGHVEMIYDGQ